MGNSICS